MWEKQIAQWIRLADVEELRRLLEEFLPALSEAQYLAIGNAVRDEGARRGLLAPRVGAGQEAPR